MLMIRRISRMFALLLLCVTTTVAFAADNNTSQNNSRFAKPIPAVAPKIVPSPPDINAKAWILMDADTGYIMAEKDPHKHLPPASLTKLMTMYVISGALENGQIHMDDKVTISKKAWKMGGSRMFVKVGSQVPVKDLIDGIIVASGNDACVAMAEYIAGTEDNFVKFMNQTAEKLGMKDTHYTDATGMPHPDHYSSAYDIALLTRAIIHNYPEDYSLYKQKYITWNNIRQPNRNRLLWRDPEVDGLKTGHTEEAGYCLVASGKKGAMRLISVVMGAPSDSARTTDSEALLNYGFRFYQTQKLANANERILEEPVWFGKSDKVALGVKQDFYVTGPRADYNEIKTDAVVDKPLKAPLEKGEQIGKLVASLNGKELAEVPLYALSNVPQANIFSRGYDHVKMFFHNLFSKSAN